MPDEESKAINISITDDKLNYESNMTISDMMFWLDVIKAMLMNKVLEDTSAE